MTNVLAEYWRHKDDPGVVIKIVQDNAGTISVCGDDPGATIFHLTRAELEFNFEPVAEGSTRGSTTTAGTET